MATSDNITILAFAGSLRKDSYNKALLRAAKKLAPKEMKIEFFDLEGIPFFSEDVEAEGDPDYVTQFKEAIRKADGLLIATPEYNYGMSSATKAAIEWASRPPKDAPLEFKPVGDRKSTRLNSSHVAISYAVFCLKKKTLQNTEKFRAAKCFSFFVSMQMVILTMVIILYLKQ